MAEVKISVVMACLVVALVAAATTGSALAGLTPPKQCVTAEAASAIISCAQKIVSDKPADKVFTKKCCNDLADTIPCGCVLRAEALKHGFDPQKPFCPGTSGCKSG